MVALVINFQYNTSSIEHDPEIKKKKKNTSKSPIHQFWKC